MILGELMIFPALIVWMIFHIMDLYTLSQLEPGLPITLENLALPVFTIGIGIWITVDAFRELAKDFFHNRVFDKVSEGLFYKRLKEAGLGPAQIFGEAGIPDQVLEDIIKESQEYLGELKKYKRNEKKEGVLY